MLFALFLGIINLLKLWLAQFLPLLGDEAYNNLWAKHLALSYTDHPPIIAYLHWLINFIFGQNEIGIRLGAILCLLVSSWLIYFIGKEAFGKKVGIASGILFNLIPTYFAGGLFLTPEQPLLIFWLLSLYWVLKIIKSQQKIFWYFLGISIGLGFLSKFTMLLFLPGLLLFLLISKENRPWLTKKEPYLALGIALFVFSPVIIWNIQHGFPSLLYHGARISSPHYLNNLLYFLILQFLMYSPPLFIFTCTLFFYKFWKNISSTDNFTLLFTTLSLPASFAFLMVSPFTLVGGHWTSILYLGIIIIACHKLLASVSAPLRRLHNWLNLGVILLINLIFIGYYAFLYPIPPELQGKAYVVNNKLSQYIKDAKVDYVFSNQMGVASLAAYYGKTEVYMPKGLWKQFDIWGQPQLKKGDDVLYFVFDNPAVYAKLKPVFKKVEIDPQKRIFTKDSDIPLKTQIFIGRNFKGGNLP